MMARWSEEHWSGSEKKREEAESETEEKTYPQEEPRSREMCQMKYRKYLAGRANLGAKLSY